MNPPKPYAITDLNEVMNGTLHGSNDAMISNISFDSRKVIQASSTLFFALKTKKNDGHNFLKTTYDKGIRAFTVSKLPIKMDDFKDCCFIEVADTLEALQKLATAHRHNFSIPIIGITGSYGKTIIKEWLFHLLENNKTIVRNPKSYNSQIGVPLSVWNINPTHEIGIFEAGISEPNEMERLQNIIQPTIGIFSNIGNMHSENFSSTKNQVQEKLKLFSNVDVLIYLQGSY